MNTIFFLCFPSKLTSISSQIYPATLLVIHHMSTSSFHATFAFNPNPHMFVRSLARSRAMQWRLRLSRWRTQICSCIVLSEQWACALPAVRQADSAWNFVMELKAKAWVQMAEGWQAMATCERAVWAWGMEDAAGRQWTSILGSSAASPIHKWRHLLIWYDSIAWPSWLSPLLDQANRTILQSRFIPQPHITDAVCCKLKLSGWLWIYLKKTIHGGSSH